MYYVCHNTHILVKGKMKKDEKNEEKKRMNPWFYAIFWLSRQKLASGSLLEGCGQGPARGAARGHRPRTVGGHSQRNGRQGRRAGPTAHGIGTAGAAQEAREPAGAGRSLPPGLSHTGVWPPINRARTISLLRKGVVFQPGPDLCGHRHHFHRAGRERPESRGQ